MSRVLVSYDILFYYILGCNSKGGHETHINIVLLVRHLIVKCHFTKIVSVSERRFQKLSSHDLPSYQLYYNVVSLFHSDFLHLWGHLRPDCCGAPGGENRKNVPLMSAALEAGVLHIHIYMCVLCILCKYIYLFLYLFTYCFFDTYAVRTWVLHECGARYFCIAINIKVKHGLFPMLSLPLCLS